MKSPVSIKNIIDSAGNSKAHLSELHSGLQKRLAFFRRDRSETDQVALEKDFGRVIEAWGIPDSSHVPLAIQALRLRFPLFAVPILVCALAAGLMQDMISYLSLVLVSLPCLAGMVTAAWRISILKKRHFQSLSRWLLSLLGSEPKRP